MLKPEIIEKNNAMSKDDIIARLAEIDVEVRDANTSAETIEERTEEMEDLKKRLKDIEDSEKREKDIKDIKNGAPTEKKEEKRENKMPEVLTRDSKEYRRLWFMNLRGDDMNEVETRAWTTAAASAAAAIPTQTATNIMDKIIQYAPLLNEITLLSVPGYVKYAVEGATADAAKHTENADITADKDTLVEVDLAGYEITKLIQISKSVQKMAIGAFITWTENMIARKLAERINYLIINGSGSGEGTGISKISFTEGTSMVTVAKTGILTEKNVQTLCGYLPAAYDANAKFLMSKKTLFGDFVPLQDNSKSNIITVVNGKYYVYGYEVQCDDRIDLDDAYLGDPEMIVGNMPEEVNITMAFDVNTNSFKILGAGMFDCKVALDEAFVKLTKATA